MADAALRISSTLPEAMAFSSVVTFLLMWLITLHGVSVANANEGRTIKIPASITQYFSVFIGDIIFPYLVGSSTAIINVTTTLLALVVVVHKHAGHSRTV